MDKYNSLRRSMARGNSVRGTTGINGNGQSAYNQSLKSNKGHYKLEFIRTFEKLSERDIELRKKYALDLLSANIAVPLDMITLRAKKASGELTLTSHDEVFYVKVGKINYGKLSLRTQRIGNNRLLTVVFQKKVNAVKPPQKAYSRSKGFKKRTTSQKQQASRKSYNNRKGGKN